MADFYTWTAAELGLNIQEMDREHQDLIAKMNLLYKGVSDQLPKERIQTLIEDLAAYTLKHFTDEEAYMTKINYPGLETHKVIHKQLLSQFGTYVEEFKSSGVVSESFFKFLKVWLTSHIRGIDMKYSQFAKTKKAA